MNLKQLMMPALVAVVVFTTISGVRSQSVAGQGTKARLQQMQETNAKLLEQQTATLKKLEELFKEAEQTKIFARRT